MPGEAMWPSHPLCALTNSPLNLTVKGALEATELIRDIVVPWRRQHAEKMAQLQEMEKFSEIEIKKAELLEKQAITTKVNAESERVQAEAEKIRAEA